VTGDSSSSHQRYLGNNSRRDIPEMQKKQRNTGKRKAAE